MKVKDIYVVGVLIPIEYTATTEMGFVELKLCKKEDNEYIDLKNGNTYTIHDQIGFSKVVRVVPLSEYYYSLGIKKTNNHYDKKSVHRLVKEIKHKK